MAMGKAQPEDGFWRFPSRLLQPWLSSGSSPAAAAGQGAHPRSEDCAVLGKMLLALLMCIWGRKKV